MKNISITEVRSLINSKLLQAADLIDEATKLEESLLLVMEAQNKVTPKVDVEVKPRVLKFSPAEKIVFLKIKAIKKQTTLMTKSDICLALFGSKTAPNFPSSKRLQSVLDKAEEMGFIIVNRALKAFTYSLTPLAYK